MLRLFSRFFCPSSRASLQETAARPEQGTDSPSKVAGEAAVADAHEALLAQV